MNMEQTSSIFDADVIGQAATTLFVLGVILVFQWGMQLLFSIGLVLLALGSLGTLLSQMMQGQYVARIVERMTVIGMMVGILGMLQPWDIWFYENGFYLLLLSTVGFIVVSHISTPEAV